MALFGKKRELVAIDTIIGRARNLSRDLQEFYRSVRRDDFSARCQVFDVSGIQQFTRGNYYSNCHEINKSTLTICIRETFGQIISITENLKQPIPIGDEDTVSVLVFQGYDDQASITFKVSVEAPRKKWEKAYGHLKVGDKFLLDGPAQLEYSHSPEGVKTFFVNPYMEKISFMAFHLKIYL